VVTFGKPFLRVKKSEVIGVIDAASDLGKGFVHWEVLTPDEGSMKDLLSFLNELLPTDAQLPADFFKEIKESTYDNLFDSEEMETIAALLPDSDAKERDSLKVGYSPETLPELLKVRGHEHDLKPAPGLQLAFDAGEEKRPKGFFATTVRIFNGRGDYQDLVPDGTYPLTLACSGGGFSNTIEVAYEAVKQNPVELQIFVPGGTDKIEIESPENLFLDPATAPPARQEEAAAASQVAFLQALSKARWRNAVVTHLNEWSKAGLKKSLQARLKNSQWIPDAVEPPDDKQIDAFVNAVAWWGINAPDGKEHALFGTTGPDQLAPDAKTESMNPLTLSWFLRIVDNAEAIEFRTPSVWHEDEANRVAYLGFAEATRKRRVGEPLELVAAEEVEPADKIPELPIVWAPDPVKLPAMPHAVCARLDLVPNEPTAKVIVELAGGDDAYWKAAAPVIMVEGHAKVPKSEPSSVKGKRLLVFPFKADENVFRQILKFRLKRKEAKYLGKKVAAQDEPLELQRGDSTESSYDNTTPPKATWKEPPNGTIEVTANVDKSIAVKLQTTGVLGNQLLELVRVGSSTRQMSRMPTTFLTSTSHGLHGSEGRENGTNIHFLLLSDQDGHHPSADRNCRKEPSEGPVTENRNYVTGTQDKGFPG
jgi:hypothetical protein